MAKKKSFKLIIAAVVLTAGVLLYLNMGGLVTRTAETIASNALGVKVNIGFVELSLSDKKVTVRSLKISNPVGYKGAYAMTADSIAIGLNTASKELIDFKNIEVKGSEVFLEVTEKGMNLDDLRTLAGGKEQRESVGSKQVRVIIEQMVIDASTIHTRIMGNDIAPIKMPALRMNGVGQGGGIEAGDAIVKVLDRYLTAVIDAARDGGLLKGLPGHGEVQKIMDDATKGLDKIFR